MIRAPHGEFTREAAAACALFRRHCRQSAAADHRRDDLGSIQQRLWRRMGVALGHPGLGVAEQSLHHIERYTLVDQEAGKRMPQVMEPDIGQTGTAPNAIPRREEVRGSARYG